MGLPHSHVKIGLFRRSYAPDPSSAALVLRFEASRGRRGTEKQCWAAAQAKAKKRGRAPAAASVDESAQSPVTSHPSTAFALPRREPSRSW